MVYITSKKKYDKDIVLMLVSSSVSLFKHVVSM